MFVKKKSQQILWKKIEKQWCDSLLQMEENVSKVSVLTNVHQ